MRVKDDFIQHRLENGYEMLRKLKQWQAEADQISHPVLRETRKQSIRFWIKKVEEQIDALMKEA